MEPTRAIAERVAVWSVLFVGWMAAGTSPAFAQAWVPPAGIGVVSLVYQDITNTSHRLTDGSRLDGYDSTSRGVLIGLDYAFTDRFSVSVGLPYLGAKYTGPEASFFGLPIDDCFCWNTGWQDVSATVRYNLTNGAFAFTPSVSLGVPSHDYEYYGEAVLGRNLNEVRLTVDAGQRLDRLSDKVSVSGRYSFALVEQVLDLQNNRSNMALEVGLLATRKVAIRGALSWQRSHGGLRSTEVETEEQLQQFDRLLKDNFFHVTGGGAYSLPRFDLFLSYTHYVSGTDTHVGYAITTGVSVPFER